MDNPQSSISKKNPVDYISRHKKIIIFIIVTLLLSLGGFYYAGGSQEKDVSEQVKEVTVTKGDLKIDQVADGKAELSTVELNFQVNGIIKEIPVITGQQVEKGEVIARLDAAKYRLEVDAARAGLEAARAKLATAREQHDTKLLDARGKLDNLEAEYRPMQEAPEVFTRQEVILKKLALENAQKAYRTAHDQTADIEAARAAVKQAQANLDKAQSNLEDTILKSPVKGIVLDVAGDVGEAVSNSGDNESKAFAVIAKDGGVTVTAQVLELDIARLTPGQAAEVEFEALPDEIFTGKVTGIQSLPNGDENDIVTYDVDIYLDAPDERIKHGMTCIVSLITEQKNDVLYIPVKAVKRVDGSAVVQKVSKTGEPVNQKVKTGFTDGQNVEILEGLQPGDTVIIRTKSYG